MKIQASPAKVSNQVKLTIFGKLIFLTLRWYKTLSWNLSSLVYKKKSSALNVGYIYFNKVIISGFRGRSIFLFDESAIPGEAFLPSTVSKNPLDLEALATIVTLMLVDQPVSAQLILIKLHWYSFYSSHFSWYSSAANHRRTRLQFIKWRWSFPGVSLYELILTPTRSVTESTRDWRTAIL